ncbi:DUF2345 domain-containing protein, partial [Chromobacterium aquaticum]
LLVLSAPAGIASLSQQSQTVAAGTNLDLVAQRDTNQTSGRRWIHNVGQHISLFVAGIKDQIALKLIAAKGKVQVQAQSDSIEVTADKDVTVTACKGKVEIAAGQEILLTSGGGYIRLKGGNIEVHCPGEVSVKGASHKLSGPASIGVNMQGFPSAERYDEQFRILGPTGKPLSGLMLAISDGQQHLLQHTRSDGSTQRVHTQQSTPLKASLVWHEILPSEDMQPPEGEP